MEGSDLNSDGTLLYMLDIQAARESADETRERGIGAPATTTIGKKVAEVAAVARPRPRRMQRLIRRRGSREWERAYYLASSYSPSTSQIPASSPADLQLKVPLPVMPLSLPVPSAKLNVPLEVSWLSVDTPLP